MNHDVKESLKKDKAMLSCFADVIKQYKNSVDPNNKRKTTKEFLSENPEVGLNAFVLLKSKDFYQNKDLLSDDFYNEMILGTIDELKKVQGVKNKDTVLDNKVGFENKEFETLSDVLKECKRSKEFVTVLDLIHENYNKNFSRKESLSQDLSSKAIEKDMIKMANIVKSNVFYEDKESLQDDFYQGMLEKAIEGTKKTFYPDEVIPYLKPEQKIIDEIEVDPFDETRKELASAWQDARKLFQEGKNLSTENNPVLSSKRDSSEQFWNGHRSSKNFLK